MIFFFSKSLTAIPTLWKIQIWMISINYSRRVPKLSAKFFLLILAYLRDLDASNGWSDKDMPALPKREASWRDQLEVQVYMRWVFNCLSEMFESNSSCTNSCSNKKGEGEQRESSSGWQYWWRRRWWVHLRRNIHNSNLSEIDIESFLETISATEDIHSFGAFVNVSPIMKENLRECADSDALAELVWGRLKYRFMYTLASDSLMFLH
jgi:hypothetical protein